MNRDELNRRCVELFQHPDVQLRCWHPRMFWETGMKDNPTPEDLIRPKVDLRELEVLLSESAHVPSECVDELNREAPGRADLIRHMARRGEMPYLQRPH
ncbi:hypothetical protein B1C78_15605 [Thioalkalivibrio denitrificans]|uniref:Uncharacterized protein n=1 Tax=Thioalkalivibrio denitrificans TaxID=108003 RepID=A0A1V3NAC6_9GAMM|nr:hypothetical protein [Thioalkalivibrio denitrificans]OOG22010.1 hypothetical protein B1C78_15605 [Thioalkalivibrio denitrificans]